MFPVTVYEKAAQCENSLSMVFIELSLAEVPDTITMMDSAYGYEHFYDDSRYDLLLSLSWENT